MWHMLTESLCQSRCGVFKHSAHCWADYDVWFHKWWKLTLNYYKYNLKKTWIKNIFSFRRNPMKRSKPIINWSFYVCIHRLINLSPVCHWAPLLCKNYETHINESHCRTERHVLLCHELMHWEFILTKPFMQHAANRNTLILMKHQMWMNTLLKIVPGTISSCLLKTENFYMLS